MILEPDAIEKLVKAMDDDKELGSACPKVLRWDFAKNKKLKIIDTSGIILKSGLKFVDLGQGEKDDGSFDPSASSGQVITKILGPSGAAAMFRVKALRKVEKGSQYFDERFFMYKEDCDLAYRLFLAGWRSKLVSDAIIYHDRTGAGAGESNLKIALNRRKKSKQVKAWSFWGQHIIFLKYWRLQSFWNKIRVLGQALKMFVFVILFEQYLLKQYWKLWRTTNSQILSRIHKS